MFPLQLEGLIASQLGNINSETIALEDGTVVTVAEYIRIEHGYKCVPGAISTSGNKHHCLVVAHSNAKVKPLLEMPSDAFGEYHPELGIILWGSWKN